MSQPERVYSRWFDVVTVLGIGSAVLAVVHRRENVTWLAAAGVFLVAQLVLGQLLSKARSSGSSEKAL